MRVLVIEDDFSIRETLGMVLEASSHEADLVTDGDQAIESLRSHWPDVVLLDLTLAGMSGEQVYQRTLEIFGKAPPTIVLSADQQGARRTQTMPGAIFLAKPYTIEQLEQVMQDATGIRAA